MKKSKIKALFEIIQTEMDANEEFRKKIEELFETLPHLDLTQPNKLRNKREPAVLDPIEFVALKGEIELKAALNELDIERLKNIVSQFRFDSSRLVMKWKDKDRIIEHIVKSAQSRDQKGDVFRK